MESIADYDFIRALGEGESGRFYLAVTPPRLGITEPEVAVKVLKSQGDGSALRRMTRELRAFSRARSDLIAALYDAGQEGTALYYSMRYYPDGSLATAGEMPAAAVVSAVRDAAEAAHSLHEAGLAHCNIKPSNVLIVPGGGRLADLRLASSLTTGMTVTGMAGVGSIEFVDPAVVRGEVASRSSDVWSLGATMHRALTGRSIYPALPDSDPLLAVRRVLQTTPELDPSLDESVRGILDRCFSVDLSVRWRTAHELSAALDALVVTS